MAIRKKEKVNLDALIRRQDLETIEKDMPPPPGDGGIPITELAIGKLYYELLRKPHFQRETDDWDIDNVVTLIKSVRDGHLIPAIIIWRGETGYTFVIDGAHRLSALIAWVNDDYGDRNISARFFRDEIPKKQKDIANECRKRVNAEVGAYSMLSQILTAPNPSQEQVRWASNIAGSLVTQRVYGDAEMAATSFLTINQRAVQIDATERFMIEARNKPNVIAARALVRSARGHVYWGKFNQQIRDNIEKKARQIYNSIFEPEDADPAINTELQPAGQAHSANGLRIALDLVNITNRIKGKDSILNDPTGEATERCIEKTHGIVKYVAGKEFASLSLHPAVYFWGATGNHQPSVFLAVVSFVQELVLNDELISFTLHRAKLEEFLISNSAIKDILGKHGGWKKSVSPVKKMLRTIFDGLATGKAEQTIEKEVLQDQKPKGDYEFETERASNRLWRETKGGLRRKASLDSAVRCPICKARLVLADASDDHKDRKVDGGLSTIDNAQLTHHYCNHGFKEYFAQKGILLPEIPSPV